MAAKVPFATSAHTPYHPRWYRARVSTWWWLGHWRFRRFIFRELSSVFVAWFVVVTLLQVRALERGPAAYELFQHRLQNPAVLAVNIMALLFVVFHTATWFNLAPAAMAVRLRGKRVPDVLIAAPNYLAWLLASGAVAYVVLQK